MFRRLRVFRVPEYVKSKFSSGFSGGKPVSVLSRKALLNRVGLLH
jgi:hypothetical protein